MEIKINVSDEKFEEIVKNELDGISKEDLRDILKEGIRNLILSKDEDGQFKSLEKSVILGYLIENPVNNYGIYRSYRPTSILENIIKGSINDEGWKDLVKDMQEETIKILKENYKEVIMNAFTKMFVDQIAKSVVGSNEMQNAICIASNEILCRARQE